jgi:hypothetical protein
MLSATLINVQTYIAIDFTEASRRMREIFTTLNLFLLIFFLAIAYRRRTNMCMMAQTTQYAAGMCLVG